MRPKISEWLDDYADENEVELYCMEPRDIYDVAVVGVVNDKVLYDRVAVIQQLVDTSEDMSLEDAVEFHYFNQDNTDMWLFLDRPEIPEIDDPDNAPPICDPSLN